MFCPNCGKAVPDGAIFCKECGARITHIVSDASTPSASQAQTPQRAAQEPALQTPQWAPSTQTPQQAPSAYAPQQTPTAPANAGERARRTRTILIAVIAAVVLLAGGIGGYLVYRNAQQQAAAQAAAEAAYNEAHTKHAVVFKVDATGYTDATASKIPVHVTGSDLDGTAVDEDAFLDAEGAGLELSQGAYAVTVVVSPLSGDGTIYDVPSTSWNVSIGDDVEPDAPVDATAQPIVLTPISDYTSVPDETLAETFDYAVRSGLDQATADTYKGATANRIQAAKDQKAAEEAAAAAAAAEAQRQAEEAAAEEAAERAKYHISTDYYEFDIPEYWRGRVTVKQDDSTSGLESKISICSSEYPDEELISVYACNASGENNAGDIGNHIVYHKDNGKGKNICISSTNYAFYAFDSKQSQYGSFGKLPVDEQRELVDLSSGGSMSYEEALASQSSPDIAFINDAIVPTIVIK